LAGDQRRLLEHEVGMSMKKRKFADLVQTSWCKIEYSVDDPKNVKPVMESDATPPMTIMSISLRTIVNHRENKTELLCATTRTWEGCRCLDSDGITDSMQAVSTIRVRQTGSPHSCKLSYGRLSGSHPISNLPPDHRPRHSRPSKLSEHCSTLY
jgi:hypothetical protein